MKVSDTYKKGVMPALESQQSKEGITEWDQRCSYASSCAKESDSRWGHFPWHFLHPPSPSDTNTANSPPLPSHQCVIQCEWQLEKHLEVWGHWIVLGSQGRSRELRMDEGIPPCSGIAAAPAHWAEAQTAQVPNTNLLTPSWVCFQSLYSFPKDVWPKSRVG